MSRREITRADLMAMDEYEKVRDQRRSAVTAMKRNRRMSAGPDITFYFENYDTMLHQIHEMLRIEKGGEAQIADELSAYNPLIPDGGNLVATMMIEIDDPGRRARVLNELGGVEEAVFIDVDGEKIRAVAESDVERTTEAGKTSSIHFLKFPFPETLIGAFTQSGTRDS